MRLNWVICMFKCPKCLTVDVVDGINKGFTFYCKYCNSDYFSVEVIGMRGSKTSQKRILLGIKLKKKW